MLALSSCGWFNTAAPDTSGIEVQGARFALTFGDITHGRRRTSNRPTAPMGVFVSVYLSGGGFTLAQGAVRAVIAQAMFHATPSEEQLENTFQLLQEYGAVLQVDAQDLLNRSDDRPSTLNEYLTALKNITERSRRRMEELEQIVDSLEETERTQRGETAQFDRAIRESLRAQDYVAAGERQPLLAEAQAKLAETQSTLEQQQDIIHAFEELLEVADRRIVLIEENREVIIAGLRVVDLPGAESIGILEQATRRRTPGGGILGF